MRTITTLDAALAFLDSVAIAQGYAIIKGADRYVYIVWEDQFGEFFGQTYPDEDGTLSYPTQAEAIPLPWRVLSPLTFTAEDVEKAAEAIWDRYGRTGTFGVAGSRRGAFLRDARAVLATIGEVEA